MPRTKAPKKREKKSSNVSGIDDVPPNILKEVNDVRRQWLLRREQLLTSLSNHIVSIRQIFDMAIMTMGPTNDLTISWDSEDENDENEVTSNQHSPMDVTSLSNTASADFESVASSFMTQSESSVSVSRKSRSRAVVAKTPAQRSNSATVTFAMTGSRTLRSSSHGRDQLARMLPPPPSVRNRFCTPAQNTVPDGSRYNAITPKVMPNTSMAVLRRPRGGEMAFAMSGSPLMVAANSNGDDICNVNLPLGNGTVLSILPNAMRPRDVPPMDLDTMGQLTQLRDNINTILQQTHQPF